MTHYWTRIVASVLLLTFSLSASGGGWLADTLGIKELDEFHDGIKEAIPPYRVVEEGANRLAREVLVELGGEPLATLIRESRRDAIRAGVRPLPENIRQVFEGFFSDKILDSVRYRVGGGNELSVARNSFRFGDRAAIVLDSVIVFSNQGNTDDLLLWAHELAHVKQFRVWGVSKFARKYVRGYDSIEAAADKIAVQWSNWAYKLRRSANDPMGHLLAIEPWSKPVLFREFGGLSIKHAGNRSKATIYLQVDNVEVMAPRQRQHKQNPNQWSFAVNENIGFYGPRGQSCYIDYVDDRARIATYPKNGGTRRGLNNRADVLVNVYCQKCVSRSDCS